MLQQIALGGTMIALPIYLQMVLEYNAMQAGPVARPALAEHVRGGAAGREARPAKRRPASIIRLGFALLHGRDGRRCSRSCPGPTPAGTSSSRW